MCNFLKLILIILVIQASYANTDILDRKVDIKDSSKLLFIGPGAMRLGIYLGLEDRIVGIEKMDFKSPNLAPYQQYIIDKKINIERYVVGEGGPGKLPSAEAVIKANPTLIIMGDYNKKVVDEFSKKVGIPIFAVGYTSSNNSYNKIKRIKTSLIKLAKATNTEQKADKIIKFLDDEIVKLSKLNLQKDSVYVGGLGFRGAHGITSTESFYPPFALLGLENAIKDKNGLNQLFVSYEAILKADPKYIFIDEVGKKIFEKEIKEQKVLSNLNAIKNSNLYYTKPYNFYSTNLENILLNSWHIAYIMGAKVDMKSKEKEIYNIFFK